MNDKLNYICELLDSIELSIYISNFSTNKIVYANKKALKFFDEDIIGTNTIKSIKKLMVSNSSNKGFIKSIIYEINTDEYIEIFINYGCDIEIDIVDRLEHTIIKCDKSLYRYKNMLESIKQSFKTIWNKEEMYLVYQPKINIDSLDIVGYEVLCRWNHPKIGGINPTEFIPFIICINKVKEFDLFVFEKSLEFQKYLISQNIFKQCSINLSVISFNDSDVLKRICDLTEKYDIEASNITIEILEHSSLENNYKTKANIKMLKNKGFKISIDDFGTGYSSLSRLYNLEFDELKIPREFILYQEKNNKQEKILQIISNLANELNIDTVVEGVEHKENYDLIKKIGFKNSQGYLHSKPLKNYDFIKYCVSKEKPCYKGE